jgi:hypothetical protein
VFQTDGVFIHRDNNLAKDLFIYFNHLNTQMAERLSEWDGLERDK